MGQLSLSGLKKTYEGKQVLHGLDVEIADGQFVVIVGPSGCGKSTLLRMVAGLEDITEGTISIDGMVMNDIDPADRGCAMVFQNYALYPHMTVRQNIGYPLKIARLPPTERARKVEEAAKILGLTEYLDRRPAQLSGGQRQRVAMGRAIVREPSVFLFDEPLSNLDATLRVQMRIEIKRLHKRLKATSVFVTHDQVEAMTLADLLIVMNKGRVEQVGSPAAIYRSPASTFVAGFMGAPAMNLLPASVGPNGMVSLDIAPQTPLLACRELAEGTLVTLGIRPEAIVIGAEGTRGLPAIVDMVEELGGSRVAYCTVKTQELAVVLPAGEEDYEGRRVVLDFTGKAWHVFDRLTGKRLDVALGETGAVEGARSVERSAVHLA